MIGATRTVRQSKNHFRGPNNNQILAYDYFNLCGILRQLGQNISL